MRKKDWCESRIAQIHKESDSSSCTNHGFGLICIKSKLFTDIILRSLFSTRERCTRACKACFRPSQDCTVRIGNKSQKNRQISLVRHLKMTFDSLFWPSTSPKGVGEIPLIFNPCRRTAENVLVVTAIFHPTLSQEVVFARVTLFLRFPQTLQSK